MKKPIKITLTLFLILLVLIPIFFFITYPFYNDIALKLKKLNIYDRTKETFITLLTTISPTPDKFKTEEFSADSIEESIKSTDIILDTKLLEELNTTLSIDNVLIEGRVFQGTSSQAMDSGFWHFPISKYPGQKEML